MKTLALSICFLLISCPVLRAQIWQRTGSMPAHANPSDTGISRIFPAGKDTLFALSGYQIFISTDSGLIWQDTRNRALATDNIFVTKSGAWLQGAYRSSDQGRNWTGIQRTESITAGMNGEYLGVAHDSGYLFILDLFRSTDDGITWQANGKFKQNYGSYHCALFYKDSAALFLLTDFALYRSSDRGVTWDSVFSTRYNIPFFTCNSSIVYVSDDSGYVYTSSSGLPDTWVRQNAAPVFNAYGNLAVFGAGSIFGGICMSQSGFISRDTGRTWNKFNWDTTQQHYGSFFTIDSSGTYFAGGSDYIYCSSDVDSSWSTTSLPVIDTGYRPAFPFVVGSGESLWVLSNTVEKFFSDLVLYHSSDDGLHWFSVTPKQFQFIYAIGNGADGSLLAGVLDSTHHNIVARTTDGGTSWTKMSPRKTNNILEYVGETSSGKIIAIDELGFCHHSEDNGKSWTIAQTSYEPNSLSSFYISDSLNLYASSPGGFSSSHDGGISWNPVTLSSASTLVTSIASAGDGSILAIFDSISLMRSIDDGHHWAAWSDGIPANLRLTGIVGDAGGGIYVATSDGVFYQPSQSTQWFEAVAGLDNLNVQTITSRKGKTLFLSTAYAEIFRADNVAGSVKFSSKDQNKNIISFPNPVIAVVQISYFLPAPQYTGLELVDELGRVVRLIRSGIEDAGARSVSFSVHDLPAGVYLLRLQSADGVMTQKVVIAK